MQPADPTRPARARGSGIMSEEIDWNGRGLDFETGRTGKRVVLFVTRVTQEWRVEWRAGDGMDDRPSII